MVLLLNYQSYLDTINCFNNLSQQKNIDLFFIIIDNCSPNNSYNFLCTAFEGIENVNVIRTEFNGGYAYGNNWGLKEVFKSNSTFDFVIVCNSDIFVDDYYLVSKLINHHENHLNVAFIAPAVKDGSTISKTSAWRIPTLRDDLVGSLSLLELFFGNKTLYKIDEKQQSVEVDCLPGSFFIASVATWKQIGLFDEGTFLYMEEAILAVKVKEKKLKNYLIPNLTYQHFKSKTISNEITSLKMRSYYIDSKIYFHKKYLHTQFFYLELLKLLFQFWKIENYFQTKIKRIFISK